MGRETRGFPLTELGSMFSDLSKGCVKLFWRERGLLIFRSYIIENITVADLLELLFKGKRTGLWKAESFFPNSNWLDRSRDRGLSLVAIVFSK